MMLGTARTNGTRRVSLRGVILAVTAIGAFSIGAAVTHPAVAAGPTQAETNKVVAELGLEESAKPVKEIVKGWKKPAKVVIGGGDAMRLEWMKEVAPGVNVVGVKNVEEAIKTIGDAEGFVGQVGFCKPELFAAAKSLKWAHFNAAGVNECVYAPELQSGKILLTNQQRVFGPAIAEHVIALMLNLTRGLDLYARMDANEHFDRSLIPAGRLRKVKDKTMLINGLGGIGTDVAQLAHGLGMKVIGIRNSSRAKPDFVEYVGLSDELPKLIGQADVVVTSVPLTKETTGLFNTAMFNRMKKGALLINVGRGPTVVTNDVIAALQSGQLGGYGTDVTDPEPLPDKHALFRAPNTIITPHMAASADNDGPGGDPAWTVMREQLRRYVAGEKIYSIVDVARGY